MIPEASPAWLRQHGSGRTRALLQQLPEALFEQLAADPRGSNAGFNPWNWLVEREANPLMRQFLLAGSGAWAAWGRLARILRKAASARRDPIQRIADGSATKRDIRALTDGYLDFEKGRHLWSKMKSEAPPAVARRMAEAELDWHRRRSKGGTPKVSPLPPWDKLDPIARKLVAHWMCGPDGAPGFLWFSETAIVEFLEIALDGAPSSKNPLNLDVIGLRQLTRRLGLRKVGTRGRPEIDVSHASRSPITSTNICLQSPTGEAVFMLTRKVVT